MHGFVLIVTIEAETESSRSWSTAQWWGGRGRLCRWHSNATREFVWRIGFKNGWRLRRLRRRRRL